MNNRNKLQAKNTDVKKQELMNLVNLLPAIHK